MFKTIGKFLFFLALACAIAGCIYLLVNSSAGSALTATNSTGFGPGRGFNQNFDGLSGQTGQGLGGGGFRGHGSDNGASFLRGFSDIFGNLLLIGAVTLVIVLGGKLFSRLSAKNRVQAN